MERRRPRRMIETSGESADHDHPCSDAAQEEGHEGNVLGVDKGVTPQQSCVLNNRVALTRPSVHELQADLVEKEQPQQEREEVMKCHASIARQPL